MRHFSFLFVALAVSACASDGGPHWSASSWNGLAPQELDHGQYNYYAAPLDDRGFKLKLTLKTDGLFGGASADDAMSDEALLAVAEQAAPDGCIVTTVSRAPDGSAIADYECD